MVYKVTIEDVWKEERRRGAECRSVVEDTRQDFPT
jgi:hypothetical protein